MAHATLYINEPMHDQIYTFWDTIHLTKTDKANFKENYQFIWDIFNEVAIAHNLKLPKTWVAADAMTRKDRHRANKTNMYILEPMGPTISVDLSHNPLSYFNGSFVSKSHALYNHNWRILAEKFFMVNKTAKQSLEDIAYIRPGVLCERWKCKSMQLTYNK